MLYNTGVTTKSNTTKEYMQVDVKSASKVSSLLINNYSSVVTPIREAIVNGLEAIEGIDDGFVHVTLKSEVMANSNKIFGTSDSDGSYSIIIEDNGIGMSHDFVTNRYLKLTNSTKDDDINAIGGFGIGAKAIMSISTHTVIRTVKDGEATVVVLGIDSNGVTQEVSPPIAVDEPNGTRVTAAVSYPTYDTIKQNLGKEFLSYLDEDTPVMVFESNDMGTSVINYDNVMGAKNNIKSVTTPSGVVVHFQKNKDCYEGWYHQNDRKEAFKVRVAGMPYPVSSHMAEELSGASNNLASSYFGAVRPVYNGRTIVLDIPARDVVVSSSRESIVDTPETVRLVASSYREAMEAIVAEVDSGMKNAQSIEDFHATLESANSLLVTHWNSREFISRATGTALKYRGETVAIIPDTTRGGALTRAYGDIFHCEPMTINGAFTFFHGSHVDSIERLRNNSDSVESFVKADMHGADALLIAREKTAVGDKGATNGDVLPDSVRTVLGEEKWNESATVGSVIRALFKWSGITIVEHERTWKSLRASMMGRGRNIGKCATSNPSKRSYGNRANDYRFHIVIPDSDEIITGSRSDLGDIVDYINNSGVSAVFIDNVDNTKFLISKDENSRYAEIRKNFKNKATASKMCNGAYLLIGTPRGDVLERDMDMLRSKINNDVDVVCVVGQGLDHAVTKRLINNIEGGNECDKRYPTNTPILSIDNCSSSIHLNDATQLVVGDTGVSLANTLADYFGEKREAISAVVDVKCKVAAMMSGDSVEDYTTLNSDTRYNVYNVAHFFSEIAKGHHDVNPTDSATLISSWEAVRSILGESGLTFLTARQLEKALGLVFETAENLRSSTLISDVMNMRSE